MCSAEKSVIGTNAARLYVSSRFQLDRALAERGFDLWYILSGQHGLLAPDAFVEPYDFDLASQPEIYRQSWGERVVSAICRALEGSDCLLEIRALAAYRDPLLPGLYTRGFHMADDVRDEYVIRLVRCQDMR